MQVAIANCYVDQEVGYADLSVPVPEVQPEI
jgi:hypothetical protein